jgi:regulator of protease activity HflC (stomatin/prohibitin superfamily)
MIREKPAFIAPGLLTFLLLFVLEVLTIAALVALVIARAPWPLIVLDILAIAVVGICFGGFLIVSPNEAQVLQLFGNYAGTVNQPGFWWTNPFTLPRRKVSQRVRNFESSHLKVNDHDGNPIEIAAIVVWRVTDTAEAVFMVDDYENFVKVQTEAAVRNLATSYAYDSHQDDRLSLRTASDEITGELRREVQDRLAKAGIEVIEARFRTSRTRRRSRKRCCAASKPVRSSRRAHASSRARSEWSRWRSRSSRSAAWSSSTRNGRRRW